MLFNFNWALSLYMLGLVINIPRSKADVSNILWSFQGHLRKNKIVIFWSKIVQVIFLVAYNIIGYDGGHGLDLLATCFQVYLDKTHQGHLKVMIKILFLPIWLSNDLEVTLLAWPWGDT